ncbi:hypothetical protein BC351_00825 [Paenibacillus ferrarius]|uniref:Resolvase/invertase-type recombinase catalytic domain-containing protein n=1 Tax=Paenibacillus ferrarius TaxID=1469647 RepID=A0A1V4HSG9_9BACL|nr:recombinase family protein [Paenibacillus ferrarius]OPH61816.1 hypothetical protein BC351_00825 [Paenibacillus ferrarius]
MKEKVVIYARVGSQEQANVSLDRQIDSCKSFAVKNDLMIKGIYKQVGASAHGTQEKFESILSNMYQSNVETLLIEDWSRISRNAIEAMEIENRFKKNNKSIVTVNGDKLLL